MENGTLVVAHDSLVHIFTYLADPLTLLAFRSDGRNVQR